MENQSEHLSKDFYVRLYLKAIDGERLAIDCLTFNQWCEEINDVALGEVIGTIDVSYPIAGLNVALTLPVTHIYSEPDAMASGTFKLPFIDTPVTIEDLKLERFYKLQYETYEAEEPPYEIHTDCGGYWRPMYDQFPNWIFFCTTCDARYENFEESPLTY